MRQRRDNKVGGSQCLGRANSYAAHAGADSCGDSGFGILEDDTVPGFSRGCSGTEEENLGIGLGGAGMRTVDDGIEIRGKTSVVQDQHRIFAGRAKGCLDSLGTAFFQKIQCTRQNFRAVHLGDVFDVPVVFLLG
ncbi:hypothetical protein D3C74_375470 [compost metagenome]